MLTAKSREPAKTKSEMVPHRTKPKVESAERIQANPLWTQLATRVQAKLTVGAVDDPLEKEADSVADQVMMMPESVVQHACPACAAGGSPCPKYREEERASIHRKANDSGASVPEGVVSNLGPGRALDAATRDFMEPRFGQDFGQVRVHTDAQAAASARAVDARAYTLGSNIVFGAGAFTPGIAHGRRLLAHELTHVVQQRHARVPAGQAANLSVTAPGDRSEQEADRVADVVAEAGAAPPIVERPTAHLARAKFDVDAIAKDADVFANMPTPLLSLPISLLFFKANGHVTGDLTKAADYPTTFTLPADRSKKLPADKLPSADAKPPLSSTSVEAHFFPSLWATPRRALVLGGFHGDEQPGWQVTDALVNELSQSGGSVTLAFHTIIVPRVNAAAIDDELAGVNMWRNRCNRQIVDLNRNFPTGGTPKDTDCKNTVGAPIQPEVQGVMDLVTKFKPDRVVSTHAISDPKSAGIFADPNQDPAAVELARGMASTANKADIPFNKLGPGVKNFNPVYPLDKPGVVSGGTSLGAWAPTAVPGRITPVITMEAPGFGALGAGPGGAPRTVEGALRPLHAFLGDPADLATAADRDIVADIDAFAVADRLAFLTGALPKADAIFERIQLRVNTAVAKLNAMSPPKSIKIVSALRLFSKQGPKASNEQAEIDFEKFFLTGSRAGGWDTLPDQFFKNGKRSDGVDRNKWLATPSKDRLNIILRFSSLPGASRHHWGTEVDLNSVEGADWRPPGPLFALGPWLQANAPSVNLFQAYTPGRSGGYQEEAWHYSYAPISVGLRERYNKQVNLTTDVVDRIVTEFQKSAKAENQTVPADFATALQAINISDLVNNIGPGL